MGLGCDDKETRRQGDKETRRQGDKDARRQGDVQRSTLGLHPSSFILPSVSSS
ncbi:MAG: hypothetical protein IPO81_28530 [Kouleothrix sp.]|nr:hypothetical protein [Kouleothrix sp.]